jgi:hypothetical protein
MITVIIIIIIIINATKSIEQLAPSNTISCPASYESPLTLYSFSYHWQ